MGVLKNNIAMNAVYLKKPTVYEIITSRQSDTNVHVGQFKAPEWQLRGLELY